MSSKKVLGRGLGALIPGHDEQRRSPGLLEVALDSIVPNALQPRKQFDESAIEELANSVRQHGIVQPLVVTRSGDRYTLIAGERRFRAAKKAGLQRVPVVVKELSLHDVKLTLRTSVRFRDWLGARMDLLVTGGSHDNVRAFLDAVRARIDFVAGLPPIDITSPVGAVIMGRSIDRRRKLSRCAVRVDPRLSSLDPRSL